MTDFGRRAIFGCALFLALLVSGFFCLLSRQSNTPSNAPVLTQTSIPESANSQAGSFSLSNDTGQLPGPGSVRSTATVAPDLQSLSSEAALSYMSANLYDSQAAATHAPGAST